MKAIQNYLPKKGSIEFVFDPKTSTLAVGTPKSGFTGSPHQQLARSIGADVSTVVGGYVSERFKWTDLDERNERPLLEKLVPTSKAIISTNNERIWFAAKSWNMIMKETLRAIFQTLLGLVRFKVGQLEKNNYHVKWFPILEDDSTSFSMGLIEDGCWCIQGRKGLIKLNSDGQYRYAISILEKSFFEVSEELRRYELNVDDNVDLVSVFPFVEIVKAGLKQASDYWGERAFCWYDELCEPAKKLILDVLKETIEAKWASQKLRQKAKKELIALNR